MRKSLTNNKVVRNASWIIACKIIQAVLGLLISMITARYLGPSNYGLISYAASIVEFVVPIMLLGLYSTLVQEIIEGKDSEGTILGTATAMSFVSSVFCVIGVFIFTFFVNAGEKETISVVMLYSLLLIFQSLELVQCWFQAKYLAKYSSIMMLTAYVVVSGYKIILLITGKDVRWFALSNALDHFVIAAGLYLLYRRLGSDPYKFSLETAGRLFSNSKYYIISGLMVTVFSQTDRVMLKLMRGDAETGYYSAAAASAVLTRFVFAAIIDSARPLILEGKKTSREMFEKNMIRLYSIILYGSFLQSIGMALFADLIIRILYGADYMPAVPALRIVVWYCTFSYIGSVRNIWLLSNNKQRYLWMINLAGALANVLLNLLLIPGYGIIGASTASLITQFFTNVIVGFIFKPIRGNNRLMVRALHPRCVLEILKKAR
ncbi:MAG: flippase [Lachnospiraceae bacterium]|nr:flippase [Lachnospiraceae bacterium]